MAARMQSSALTLQSLAPAQVEIPSISDGDLMDAVFASVHGRGGTSSTCPVDVAAEVCELGRRRWRRRRQGGRGWWRRARRRPGRGRGWRCRRRVRGRGRRGQGRRTGGRERRRERRRKRWRSRWWCRNPCNLWDDRTEDTKSNIRCSKSQTQMSSKFEQSYMLIILPRAWAPFNCTPQMAEWAP
jgi:hypothetical protein